MSYQYVLFDLDGTITEPVIGITNAYMYALKKFGIEVSDRSELHCVIGPPLRQSFQEYYGLNSRDTEKAILYYREYYGNQGLKENDLMPGIRETINKLKEAQKKLYVATSKPEEYAKKILQYLDMDQEFEYIAGSSMDASRDNKIAVMEYLLNKIKKDYPDMEISECIMIGDRCFDIDGANYFNMDSIGVLFGYGNSEELEGSKATYIVDTAEKIVDIIN